MSPRTAEPARNAGGFVDNARALPTTPPAPQQQPGRTFHSPYKADIFTRYRQPSRQAISPGEVASSSGQIGRCTLLYGMRR